MPTASTLTNRASVSTTTTGDDPADNDASADVTVDTHADLSLTKTAESHDVVAGEPTTFQVAVHNGGPSDAQGLLVVTDDLPDGMSFLSADAPWSCDPAAQTVTCTLDAGLVAGADAPGLVLRVQVAAGAPDGDLVNEATVTSATDDPDPANNTDHATVTIGQEADLSVSKTHTGTPDAGDSLDFTVAVHNAGPSVARQVHVVDTLPAGMTYSAASGDGWTCVADAGTVTCDRDGDLGPGDDAPTLTLTVDIAVTAFGTLTNTADVSSQTPDPNEGNNTSDDPVDVTQAPGGITLEKSAGAPRDADHDGRIDVGDTIAYSFLVTNTGTVPLTGIVVHDSLVGTVECPQDTLPAGGQMTCHATYHLTQRDLDRGGVHNSAHVTGENPAGTVVDSGPDDVDSPLPTKPGLSLVKRAHLLDRDGDGRADAGERIAYTFVVMNVGTVTVHGVRVDDPMLRAAHVVVHCPRSTLEPGESMTCHATYTVVATDLDGSIRNVATADAHTPAGPVVTSPADHAVVPVDGTTEPPPGNPGNPPGTLPNTGGPRLQWLELGVLALLLGAVCLVAGARGGRQRD